MNYKDVNSSYMKLISDSVASDKEIKKLSQMKSFLDTSLKDALSKTFQSDNEKISYLTQVLFQTRDYLIAENIENSFKLTLLKAFRQIDEEFRATKVNEGESSVMINEEIPVPEKKTLN